jgi:hypothetical protein
MSEIGPPQGNLFAAAARRADKDGGAAQPQTVRVAAAAGVGRNKIAAPAAEPLLWIDAAVREAIGQLIGRARAAAERGAPDRWPALTIAIPFGFIVGYSEEKSFGGWVRHLAVALAAPDSEPDPVHLRVLLGEFGFRTVRLDDLDARWRTRLGNNRKIVHMVERFVGFEPGPAAARTDPDYLDDAIADPDAASEESE